MSSDNHHVFRWVVDPSGCVTQVDELIADLMVELWDADIHTVSSCQGGCSVYGVPSPASIMFAPGHGLRGVWFLKSRVKIYLVGSVGVEPDCRIYVKFEPPDWCPEFEEERVAEAVWLAKREEGL